MTEDEQQDAREHIANAGDITTRLGISDGRVVMLWDRNIAYLYLTADQADKMADALKRHAADLRKVLGALTKD